MKRRAFTLVELLVVIAIIGLLSTVAVVATANSRVKARNAKRLADVKQLANAFNVGVSVSGNALPSTGGDVWVCVSSSCGAAWSSFSTDNDAVTFISSYLSPKVSDPTGGTRAGTGYVYDGAWGGGGSLPSGVYISFMLEGSVSCGSAVLWIDAGTYTQCLMKLD